MANFFQQYLDNLFNRITNPKGNMGDFFHASNLFTHSNFRLAPKQKFLYHTVFELSQDALKFASTFSQNPQFMTEVNMLVKSADLPKMNMEVVTKNQYNRKKNVQTAIAYDPVNITFHDDNLGLTTALLEGYYRYYFRDGNYDISANNPPFDPRNLYKNDVAHGFRYGFDNDSIGPFFDKITIYQLSRQAYTGFTLVNPIITSIQHDTMDSYGAADTVANQVQVAYEAVVYTRGGVEADDPKGFGDLHYDKYPSPLTPLGGGNSSIFGVGGILDSIDDVYADITGDNFGLDTILTAINLYQNTKDLNSESVRNEGLKIGTYVLDRVINGLVIPD